MENKNQNLFGKLLKSVHNAKRYSNLQAVEELWKRNGLSNPTKRDGYKLAETVEVQRNGTEIKEYRLYKLVDATVVTISTEVTASIESGLDKLKENNRDGQARPQDTSQNV